jgi:RNA polymerase sigma factor (sigma-70 family)
MGNAFIRKTAAVTVLHPPETPAPDSAARHDKPRDLKSLYRAHWQELQRYVTHSFGRGPPEPEDVAQIAFARYAALDKPDLVQNPRAFLFTTARNIVLDHRRSQDRADRYIQDALVRVGEKALDEISPERVLMERERFDVLSAVIQRLPAKQQRVIAMNRYHGMTYEEIAARTGWSLADISRQVTRALSALDAALKAMDQH